MLRFILKTKRRDSVSGYEGVSFSRVDVDVPELEEKLNAGGIGIDSYEVTILVGVCGVARKE